MSDDLNALELATEDSAAYFIPVAVSAPESSNPIALGLTDGQSIAPSIYTVNFPELGKALLRVPFYR